LLIKELPYIAGCAVAAYSKMESGARIPCSMDDLNDSIESYEEEYTEFLSEHVAIDKTHRVTFREMTRFFEWGGFRSNFDKGRLKKILANSHNATMHKYRVKKGEFVVKTKVWEGVRLINLPPGIADQVREDVTFIVD
jgi:hypothetical protein